jgi:hypothetical protein
VGKLEYNSNLDYEWYKTNYLNCSGMVDIYKWKEIEAVLGY